MPPPRVGPERRLAFSLLREAVPLIICPVVAAVARAATWRSSSRSPRSRELTLKRDGKRAPCTGPAGARLLIHASARGGTTGQDLTRPRATLRRGDRRRGDPRPRAASDAHGGSGRWRSGSAGGSGSRTADAPGRAARHAWLPVAVALPRAPAPPHATLGCRGVPGGPALDGRSPARPPGRGRGRRSARIAVRPLPGCARSGGRRVSARRGVLRSARAPLPGQSRRARSWARRGPGGAARRQVHGRSQPAGAGRLTADEGGGRRVRAAALPR